MRSKKERQEVAQQCATKRAKRSPLGQIRELDKRLGFGVGATRERRRLLSIIEEEKR